MTKCCGYTGGGLHFVTEQGFVSANVLFSHLVLLHNKAVHGGGMTMNLAGTSDQIVVTIRNCKFSHGSASKSSGGLYSVVATKLTSITIQNTDFVENSGHFTSEIQVHCTCTQYNTSLSMLNSTIQHTINHYHSLNGVTISGFCSHVKLSNTKMTFALQLQGFSLTCSIQRRCMLQMDNCQFVRSNNVPTVLYLYHIGLSVFTSCTFSNNTGGESVITMHQLQLQSQNNSFINCTISDNNMTGITLLETVVHFSCRNVIQNNRKAWLKLSGLMSIFHLSEYFPSSFLFLFVFSEQLNVKGVTVLTVVLHYQSLVPLHC